MDKIHPKQKYKYLLAEKTVDELKKRNMDAFYCDKKEDAVRKILEIVAKEDIISCAGSRSVRELGINEIFRDGEYQFLSLADVDDKDERERIARDSMNSDYFLMGSNAVSVTGELVNIDGYGNRVASLVFGPKNVIVIAGVNKIEPNLDAAILRAKSYATPITLLGFKEFKNYDELMDAASDMCNQVVITNFSMVKGRIKVIIVGEELGY